MNVKRIIVDELPEDGCSECRFSKVYTSRFGNDKVRCAVTNKSVSDFAFGYTKQPRPSWCPLEVENEEFCEWTRELYEERENYFECWIFKPPSKEGHAGEYDRPIEQLELEYKFCPFCGKRIVYVESEE